MGKGHDVELAGSKERNDGLFEKAQKIGSQTNYYVGDKESGAHCHMYKNEETGNAGVVHRGECNVCKDKDNDTSGK